MKIAVIGAGNMGGALIKGWAKAASKKAEGSVIENLSCINIADRAETILQRFNQDFPGINTFTDNAKAVKEADIVIIAVKPWLVELVAKEIASSLDLTRQIVVSDAAGITTDKLTDYLSEADGIEDAHLFYVIPNIGAEFGKSMTFVAPGVGTSQESIDKVKGLFSMVGEVNVCEEKMVGPGMMMASCGIAYVMRYIRAQMEAGVEMGFYPKDAQQIAMQTMEGAVTLLRETGLLPEAAIDKVTTPGGTTIKGLNELDHAGFNSAVIRSLKAGLK